MAQKDKPTITNAVKKFTSKERTEQAIRELIEYHVTEALGNASLTSKLKNDVAHFVEGSFPVMVVDKQSILNAYPLTNIK